MLARGTVTVAVGGSRQLIHHAPAPCSLASVLQPLPVLALRRLMVTRVAAVEQPETSAVDVLQGEAAPTPDAAAASQGTRTPRKNNGQRRTQRQPRTSRDPATLSVMVVKEDTIVGGLCTTMLKNNTLESTATGGSTPLRLVCRGTNATLRAIWAVARANQQLADSSDKYRLRVTTSVARKPGVTVTQTLNRDDFTAYLFVTKIEAEKLPSVVEGAPRTRASRNTQWPKLAGHLLNRMDTEPTAVLESVGNPSILTMYRGLMLARYIAVRGKTANASVPAGNDANGTAGQQQQQEGGNGGNAAQSVRKVQDLAFVPQQSKAPGSEGKELSVLTFQVVGCEPPAPTSSPEMRLVTPRPFRKQQAPTSPRAPAAGRKGQQGGATGGAQGGNKGAVTTAQELASMKAQLDSMVAMNQQLMALVQSNLAQGGNTTNNTNGGQQ